jgi:hypothetical protein
MSGREWIDELGAGSLQRHALRLVAIAAPPGACALAAAVGSVHRNLTVALLALGFLALLSAMQPDGYLPLLTVVATAGYWIVVVPDDTSPWSMALAALLYLFHTVTALMAMAPASATLGRETLWRYTARSGLIALLVVVTWAIVELFAGRHAPGNAVLTGAVVVLLIAAAFVVRASSLGSPETPEDAKTAL